MRTDGGRPAAQSPAGPVPPQPAERAPAGRPPGPGGGPPGHALMMPVAKPKDLKAALRRLAGLLARERAMVALVVLLAVVSVTLAVLGPKVLGHATDILFQGFLTGHVDFDAVGRTLIVLMVIYTFSAAFAWLQQYLMAGVAQRTMFKLREAVDQKLARLPLRYYDDHPRGDVLSRITNDIDNISNTLQQSLTQIITAALTIVGVLIMMLTISWLLALISVLVVPVSMGITLAIAKRSQKQFAAQWERTGDLNGQVEEDFSGHNVIKVFGRQDEAIAAFDERNARLFESSFRAQFISGMIQPVMWFVGNLNFVAICVIGGVMVANGRISLGDVQAFIQYSRQFTMPIAQVASIMNVLQSAAASSERVFELLDEAEEEPDPKACVSLAHTRGHITFEDVSFRYVPDSPLIEDMTIDVPAGATVAIVGPTGAGKTTLVNLLLRFYEIDGGRIVIDGCDTRDMTRSDLRRLFGMVLQDTWLFTGSIRDNIAYGREGAAEDEVMAAAKAARVDHFVRTLPDGYETVLDDEATNVSQGERQLLTIARAFLADPDVLILDEATSSVDTRTEVLIQQAMAALMKERTSFVIAHRLSTIRGADTILVMDHGRLIEQGTHEELLERRGFYHDLYQSQFTEALDEAS
jgi:ATP-binding cassette, subfamily B, multidrug efflux pump